jgi:hypothetical protein
MSKKIKGGWPWSGGVGPKVTSSFTKTAFEQVLREFFFGKKKNK